MTATCDYIRACGALKNKAENRKDEEEQMICPRCGANNQDGNKFCVNCGAQLFNPNYNVPPMQQNYNQYQWQRQKGEFYKKTWVLVLSSIFIPPLGIIFSWMASRPKKTALRILLTVLLTISSINFMAIGSLILDGVSTKQETVESSEENHGSEQEEAVPEEPTISPEEYKAQCQEVSYSDMMRNPDQFVGQKFKITVKISSVSRKMTAGTYYKAYTDDGSGNYWDKMIWVFDKRDEDSDDYIKILEDDIVTFYGEFNGLQVTKNALNDEKGEDFALDAYYVDIVQEAQ